MFDFSSAQAEARPLSISILGSAGLPARYGGFETLAEQLVHHHAALARPERLTVYGGRQAGRNDRFLTADLRRSILGANGVQSIPYDIITLRDAISRGTDVALVLGVSGAMALPLLRRGRTRIVTHLGGLEWQREKWSRPVQRFLRQCEACAVRHSDAVIADNDGIACYLRATYGISPEVITYGGNHATAPQPAIALPSLPPHYALALARIEPENNPEMILSACARAGQPLVFVGTWQSSRFGRRLRRAFGGIPTITLLEAEHDPARLRAIRARATLHIHGHSAGGTNPALVEMMHFGIPVLAHDNTFNRITTEGQAEYFASAEALGDLLTQPRAATGAALSAIARRRYRWDLVAPQYFNLMQRVASRAA